MLTFDNAQTVTQIASARQNFTANQVPIPRFEFGATDAAQKTARLAVERLDIGDDNCPSKSLADKGYFFHGVTLIDSVFRKWWASGRYLTLAATLASVLFAVNLQAATIYTKYFTSLGDLLAANPTDVSTLAAVKYLTAAGEEDTGSIFYYDSASTAVTNGVTVWKPNSYGGRWIRSNAGGGSGSTNLSVSNFFATNIYVSNFFATNIFVTNAYFTNVYTSNFFATNIFTTNLYVTNVISSNIYATNIFVTNLYVSNIFSGSLVWTNDATVGQTHPILGTNVVSVFSLISTNQVAVGDGTSAARLDLGDGSANTFTLLMNSISTDWTNLWPQALGSVSNALMLGTNGQLFWGTPGGGGSGDTIWTNDNNVLHPIPTNADAIRLGDIQTDPGQPNATFLSVRNITFGDTNENNVYVAAIANASFDYYSDSKFNIIAHDTNPRSDLVLSAFGTNFIGILTLSAGASGYGKGIHLQNQASNPLMQFLPDISDGNTPHVLDTSLGHTSGNLLDLKNAGTNKFAVDHTGAIITGGSSTSGVRLDLESGALAVREGDDSSYAPLISGDLTIRGVVTPAGIISPSTITSDQNNYNPTGFSTTAVLRAATDATRSLTGLQSDGTARLVTIQNVGSFSLVLVDQSASSATTNRFELSGDVTIPSQDSAILQYDVTTLRWRSSSSPGGGGTLNSIPKWTSTSTLGNSALTDDGTAINLTGTHRLDIYDGLGNSPGLRFEADTDTGIYRLAAGEITFTANGTTTGSKVMGIQQDHVYITPTVNLTGSAGLLRLNPTWNHALRGQALDINMTDTASAANSSTIRSTVGGIEGMSVRKDGAVFSIAGSMGTNDSTILGGTLAVRHTAAQNTGTGEDDLQTFAVDGNTLSTNGNYLEFEVAGSFAANVNAKRLKVYFGATVILDTTSLVFNGLDWNVHGKVVRTGAATQLATATVTVAGTLLGALTTTSTDVTTPGETLTAPSTFKCTGEATSDGDVVQNLTVIRFYQNPGN